MMKRTLTEAEIALIKDALAEAHEQDGRFNVEVELDDMTIVAKGWLELDGYREDDYYNGTGAWIETVRNGHVELTGYTESERVDIDLISVYRISNYLNAA